MSTKESARDLLARLGECLQYPADREWEGLVEKLEGVALVREFSSLMGSMQPWMRQEHYVQSFDVMPACSLYLSVHLFGEESFKRAEFMAGLKAIYDKNGFSEITELPDHLGVVLKYNRLFSDEEWTELALMCLLPALTKMVKELESRGNHYALILRAIAEILKETEKAHV